DARIRRDRQPGWLLFRPVRRTPVHRFQPVHCEEWFMRKQFSKAALSVTLGALCATVGFAQAPGPARGQGGPGGPGGPGGAPATSILMVANPTYTVLTMEVAINRPADEVWKRVGKF